MNEVVSNVAGTLVLGVTSLAAAYVMMFIRRLKAKAELEIKRIQDEQEQKMLQAALDQIDGLATATVMALEQTVAKDLREEIKKGNADRNTLLNLAPTAAAKVYANMKPEYLNALYNSMNDVSAYVTDLIESKVLAAKPEADGR